MQRILCSAFCAADFTGAARGAAARRPKVYSACLPNKNRTDGRNTEWMDKGVSRFEHA
jgi:hypothetical protein